MTQPGALTESTRPCHLSEPPSIRARAESDFLAVGGAAAYSVRAGRSHLPLVADDHSNPNPTTSRLAKRRSRGGLVHETERKGWLRVYEAAVGQGSKDHEEDDRDHEGRQESADGKRAHVHAQARETREPGA